jgi:hypothetical protein
MSYPRKQEKDFTPEVKALTTEVEAIAKVCSGAPECWC